MITRIDKIRNVRDHARTELFEAGQSLRRVVNDMFDVADSDMIRHAVELADAIAAVEGVRRELVEETNQRTRQAEPIATDMTGHIIENEADA